jgi:hypothetical protein
MPNHYHLVLRQEAGGSISRFLQTTFNAFVQFYNVSEKHSGTLFQGSAKSNRIRSDEHLLRVVRYVHLNPVGAKMVRRAAKWEFSDCSMWVRDAEGFPGKAVRDAWFKTVEEYERFLEVGEPEEPGFEET